MVTIMEKAAFGAGCFWGVEEAFSHIEGVLDTAVGFMGGTTKNPTYKEVCTGLTGHAEVVLITYDPQKVTYQQLLDIFWSIHDPTQYMRQGPDVGSQYRSVIFYYNSEQEKAAKESIDKLNSKGDLGKPVVTEVVPASEFYRAEEYHQKYLEKRGKKTCGG